MEFVWRHFEAKGRFRERDERELVGDLSYYIDRLVQEVWEPRPYRNDGEVEISAWLHPGPALYLHSSMWERPETIWEAAQCHNLWYQYNQAKIPLHTDYFMQDTVLKVRAVFAKIPHGHVVWKNPSFRFRDSNQEPERLERMPPGARQWRPDILHQINNID